MKKIILLILVASLYSCLSKNSLNDKNLRAFTKSNKDLQELKIANNENIINLDSVFDQNIWYLKLETNPNCLIGKIDKVLFSENYIYVVDKEISKDIFIYSYNGKFIRKISAGQKQKDRFVQIQDVILNSKNKQVLLLDVFSQKIFCYAYNGDFINTIPMIFNFHSFACLDSNQAIFNIKRGDNNNLPKIDAFQLVSASFNGQLYSKGFFNKLKSSSGWTTNCQLWKFDQSIYYNPPFCDTIYRITKDTIYSEISLNFYGQNIPESDKKNWNRVEFDEIRNKYGFFNGDFICLNDFIYLNVIFPKRNMNVFYSKKTGHLLSGSSNSSKNPFLSLFFKPIARYKDNTLVMQISGYELNKLKSWQNLEGWKEINVKYRNEFSRLCQSSNEDDNPTLLFYSMKNF